jgi:hypothetical protein
LKEADAPGRKLSIRDLTDYVYEPLLGPGKDNDQYIRLLTIKSGDGTEDLVYELTTVNLRLKLKYETISYVWGTSDRTAEIFGSRTQRNVDHGLWINQLSINQNDIAERNRQVDIMDAISSENQVQAHWFMPGRPNRKDT